MKECTIPGKPLQFNTLSSYKVSNKDEFMLFQLNEIGNVYVCDFSLHNSLESRFTFIPVVLQDKPISVSSILEGPFRMCILQQTATLVIVGVVKSGQISSDCEYRFGIAKIDVSKVSVLGMPRFFSLSGKELERSSLFSRIGSFYGTKADEMVRLPTVSTFSKSDDEKRIVILTTTGSVLIFGIPENKVISRMIDSDGDGESDTRSYAALSVINPVDYSRVNSVMWWNSDILLITDLQGNMALMRWNDWSMLTKEWKRYELGVLAVCREGITLIINDYRTLLENGNKEQVIWHQYRLSTFHQVSPWERYLVHIEQREYGEATKLATLHHYDTNIIYKYKYLSCLDCSPSLQCYRDTAIIPDSVWITNQSKLLKYEEIEPILNRITDIRFVLTQIYFSSIQDRSGTINILKTGLRRCNQYLANLNFTTLSGIPKDMDVLTVCKSQNYSYILDDLRKDETLAFVVLMKFLLCQKLLRIRFFNTITAMNHVYSGFNTTEFNMIYSGDIKSICERYFSLRVFH